MPPLNYKPVRPIHLYSEVYLASYNTEASMYLRNVNSHFYASVTHHIRTSLELIMTHVQNIHGPTDALFMMPLKCNLNYES